MIRIIIIIKRAFIGLWIAYNFHISHSLFLSFTYFSRFFGCHKEEYPNFKHTETRFFHTLCNYFIYFISSLPLLFSSKISVSLSHSVCACVLLCTLCSIGLLLFSILASLSHIIYLWVIFVHIYLHRCWLGNWCGSLNGPNHTKKKKLYRRQNTKKWKIPTHVYKYNKFYTKVYHYQTSTHLLFNDIIEFQQIRKIKMYFDLFCASKCWVLLSNSCLFSVFGVVVVGLSSILSGKKRRWKK